MKIDLILIGDGMSGKTTLIKKHAELVFQQFALKFEQYLIERGLPSFSQWKNEFQDINRALKLIERDLSASFMANDPEYPQKKYFEWATRNANVIKFEDWLNHLGVDLGNHLSTDTSVATLGMDTIQMKYPIKDDLIHISGYDLGGQNIYDQIRDVITGLAKPESFLVVVFDSSRFLSCENSIRQLLSSLKKFEMKEYTPTIIAVLNKIDLQDYMSKEKWQEFTAKHIATTLQELRKKDIKYQVPNLLFKEEIREIILPRSDLVGFEHLEALIYHSLKKNEPAFGKNPFTEINTKAIAREIAAQLLLYQNPNPSYYEGLRKLLFEQRPLAIQYIEGISLTTSEPGRHEKEALRRLRKKFEGFELDLTSINANVVKAVILNTINTKDLEMTLKEQGYPLFKTNALEGTGIPELFDYITKLSREKQKDLNSEKRRKIPRRLGKIT